MLWRKTEYSINADTKKVYLERKFLWGRRRVRKYVEQDLPSPNGHAAGMIFSLTRRRIFWRFRLWKPLQSTYFTLNLQGRWIQMCRTYH
ncbi:MAG: hypothetical protein OEZ05_02790 [Nitrospirota bacterium]|nr:hypothetical protein [Nitrospirota bacterium]MDH5585536.1 hypothetical protein [Nitrospirota bacterium]